MFSASVEFFLGEFSVHMLDLFLMQICFTGSAGAGFTPHVIFVKTGEV